MGFLKYVFKVSAEQKKADKREYQILKGLVKVANDKMCAAYSEIYHICNQDENFYQVCGKCVIDKWEFADVVAEPGDAMPFNVRYKCPYFNDDVKCTNCKCSAIEKNHKYMEQKFECEYLKWKQRFFWMDKYTKAK